MHLTAGSRKIMVSADGTGIVSQAGGLLLTRVLRVTGLAGLEEALERWQHVRAVHSPGKIVTDLAAALALGGDCLADVAMLRSEPARGAQDDLMPEVPQRALDALGDVYDPCCREKGIAVVDMGLVRLGPCGHVRVELLPPLAQVPGRATMSMIGEIFIT